MPLAESSRPSPGGDKYVSFRDSALTQLLKDPLTGCAAHVTVILALRAEQSNDSETQSTMRFGTVCKDAAGSSNMRAKSVPSKGRTNKAGAAAGALAELRKQLMATTEEVERMTAEGQDEHVNPQGFAAPTIQGFLDNKAKFEDAKRLAAQRGKIQDFAFLFFFEKRRSHHTAAAGSCVSVQGCC